MAFLLATHLFVVSYEEPALSRLFDLEYEATAGASVDGGRPGEYNAAMAAECN
jgi:hypothetical protein